MKYLFSPLPTNEKFWSYLLQCKSICESKGGTLIKIELPYDEYFNLYKHLGRYSTDPVQANYRNFVHIVEKTSIILDEVEIIATGSMDHPKFFIHERDKSWVVLLVPTEPEELTQA
jgi:hypothetical protein